MAARAIACLLAATTLCALVAGCERENLRPGVADGGWEPREVGVSGSDVRTDLGPAPDGLPQNQQGPLIEIVSPAPASTVVGDLLRVRARITDDDGVDPQSVAVTLQGRPAVPMTLGSQAETYEAVLELAELSGEQRLWVVASDLLGHGNSRQVVFRRDPGPRIEFLAPAEGGRHKGSLKVEVLVSDTVELTRFELTLAGELLPVQKQSSAASSTTRYTVTVDFDDHAPPLTGEQVLTATAENENQAVTVARRTFFVDVEGPTITVQAPAPGQVVGGVVQLVAEVSDPAGLLPSSVRCVVGNDFDQRQVQLVPAAAGASLYLGEVDTSTLQQTDLWPVVSFRATDTLGNERHVDFQIGLDNGPPIIALDPPFEFFMGRHKSGELQCSHPFDPVGPDAANDNELVPQVVPIRARIEDQGNPSISAAFVPLALVDQSSVSLYVLDDTSKPLVVDTTGDGYCDSINPNVVPVGSAPKPGEAVADQLAPVPPTGEPDYTPWQDPAMGRAFPSTACVDGDDQDPPEPLCLVSSLTRAIFYAADPTEPALYVIPPVAPQSRIQCLGLPFDFGANQFADGWVCAAAEATDRVGNRGVSRPLRLWVNKSAPLSHKGSAPPGNAGSPPDCTGTLDPATGSVSTKACKFRGADKPYPQVFGKPLLRVE